MHWVAIILKNSESLSGRTTSSVKSFELWSGHGCTRVGKEFVPGHEPHCFLAKRKLKRNQVVDLVGLAFFFIDK